MGFIVNYNSKNEIKIFYTTDELSDYLGNIWKSKTDNLREGEFYSIALSGGNTPIKIFQYLSKNYKDRINWNRVKFFWGDERCVPPNDSDSNYKLAKDYLFNNIQITEENIFRIKGEIAPNVEADDYANILKSNLKSINGVPQIDFVLLGLGEDGHTASIFPHQIELFNSDRFCEVAVHPISGQKRITITGSVINNAGTIAIIAVGKNKADRVYEIINNTEVAKTYPASLVNLTNSEVNWFLDSESASRL